MSTAAIILSAGQGKRLADLGDKPFLKYKGKIFLENIVEKIQHANYYPIIVVTNKLLAEKINTLKMNIVLRINLNPSRGMLSSLWCAIDCLDCSVTGFLLNPVDFPLVKQKTYQKLWKLHQDKGSSIIKPVYQNKSGHPVIFPSVVFDDFKKAPLIEGARFIFKKHPHLVQRLKVDDPGILFNINTLEDYFKYCV